MTDSAVHCVCDYQWGSTHLALFSHDRGPITQSQVLYIEDCLEGGVERNLKPHTEECIFVIEKYTCLQE